MIPQLFYTLKMSHLTALEQDLRQMRTQINELHVLEKNASSPDFKEIDALDAAYINLLSAVQRLRVEVQPLAIADR